MATFGSILSSLNMVASQSFRRNAADNAFEAFVATDRLVTMDRETASYTLVLANIDQLVEMNVASANNLTVPTNASVAFPVGTQISIAQYGAGQTTIVAAGGVTIRSSGGKMKLTGQYSSAVLIKIATDEWYLFGDIAA